MEWCGEIFIASFISIFNNKDYDVNVTLKNGQSIGGVLESENNKSIVLKAGNNQKQEVAKNEISKRENAASRMMEVKDYLNKKEIRDLVGFLSNLETE